MLLLFTAGTNKLGFRTLTICVIIPCQSPRIKQLRNDPRLQEFFRRAQANQARFVIARMNETKLADLGLFSTPLDNIVIYPAEGLVEFAHELVYLLTNVA